MEANTREIPFINFARRLTHAGPGVGFIITDSFHANRVGKKHEAIVFDLL